MNLTEIKLQLEIYLFCFREVLLALQIWLQTLV